MFTIIYKHYIVKNITFYIHDQSHFVLILIVLAILNMLCLQEIEMFRFRVQSWKPSTISLHVDFLKCVQNSFSSKRKSVQKVCQDFLVSTQICTMTRKSRHTFCTDLRLEENEKNTWENLDGQKLLGVSVSGNKKSNNISLFVPRLASKAHWVAFVTPRGL